ncbi:MAG: AAA family ATPase [Oscillospiraceae bacterium]|jgi:ATP-dependent Clp protease ATP-binding subunit ClpA|nr:AAA family ATPase [Oscillospiraceae bacterium]
MLCTRCKKRPAVIFMTKIDAGETVNEGLCITCARELGIRQVDDIVKKMGLSYEEIENMNEQLIGFVNEINPSKEAEENKQYRLLDTANMPLNGKEFSPKEKFTAEKSKSKKEIKRRFLDGYCVNLNKKVQEGYVDDVIGREKEERRIVQILNRRTKNNVCLVGEPGVGKTAIVEEIARKIVKGTVPAKLANKEIFLLDLTALVAGTQFRGQFESRIKNLVDEVKVAGNVILFIDEMHNLVGTGDSEGTMNAANILKPALSRGEIQVIGATTFEEYRKYIEKDSALERRFQPVKVDEPSVQETIKILNGIKCYYEFFHNVKVSEDVIEELVELAERYVTDRFLPDKAIDLLDEACSSVALNYPQLVEYNMAKVKLDQIVKQETELSAESDIATDYELLAKLRAEKLRYEVCLNALEGAIESIRVTKSDLASVIELWTGIPATKITETDTKKLKELETQLKKVIVGQDDAVKSLCLAVIRAKVKLTTEKRPISFVFVGPTGVGKTQLAKLLACELFGDIPEPLIKLDMSEFMEKHAISKIIGAPPGYIGYDEAGGLTEKVRRRPYSILLFDEIEKAHPDVMNILLQVLDDGVVTDSHGRKISFAHTIIIMTSNAGSNFNGNALGFNKDQVQVATEKMKKSLSEFLRPEFLARVDEVIAFNQLTKQDYEQITRNKLEEFKTTLHVQQIEFFYDDDVVEFIKEKTFGVSKTGVRGILKIIRSELEDKICEHIVINPCHRPRFVTAAVENGKLVLEVVHERILVES